MPQVQGVDDELRQEYFNSYIDTYLMSDVTEAGGIKDRYCTIPQIPCRMSFPCVGAS